MEPLKLSLLIRALVCCLAASALAASPAMAADKTLPTTATDAVNSHFPQRVLDKLPAQTPVAQSMITQCTGSQITGATSAGGVLYMSGCGMNALPYFELYGSYGCACFGWTLSSDADGNPNYAGQESIAWTDTLITYSNTYLHDFYIMQIVTRDPVTSQLVTLDLSNNPVYVA
jgi:hypothetical protein